MSDEPAGDLEIEARASAETLRARRRAHVEVHADETWSARERLPDPVPAGVPFRHVRVAMRAVARLTSSGYRTSTGRRR
jgi:hypothetical protein